MMWKASTSLLAFPELETAGEDTFPMGIPNDVRADAAALMGFYARKDPVIEPSKKDNDGKPDAEDKECQAQKRKASHQRRESREKASQLHDFGRHRSNQAN